MAPKLRGTPYHRVPKIAFLFLVRGDLPLRPLWEKFFAGHQELCTIYVHADPSYTGSPPEDSVFYGRMIPSQVNRGIKQQTKCSAASSSSISRWVRAENEMGRREPGGGGEAAAGERAPGPRQRAVRAAVGGVHTRPQLHRRAYLFIYLTNIYIFIYLFYFHMNSLKSVMFPCMYYTTTHQFKQLKYLRAYWTFDHANPFIKNKIELWTEP